MNKLSKFEVNTKGQILDSSELKEFADYNLWENEKLLVMSNFSFSQSVFKRLVLQIGKNQGLSGKGLTHSHTTTPFDAPGKQAFRKHCGKWRNCS